MATTRTAMVWMTKANGKMRNSRRIGKSTWLWHRDGVFKVICRGDEFCITPETSVSIPYDVPEEEG
jgi:hypothetical protein